MAEEGLEYLGAAFSGLGLGGESAGAGMEDSDWAGRPRECRKHGDGVTSTAPGRVLLVGEPMGRVRLLHSAAATVNDLKHELEALCQVPVAEQMLSCPSYGLLGLLDEDSTFSLPDYSMLHLRVRCLGGKGGFGAMLRGHVSRPGMKKADANTGAMRDLSGRRLRHVEQEAQLKDWVKDEGKRKQDKEAEKKEKRAKHYQEVHAAAEEYVAATVVDQDAIADAVRQGIEEEKKRKKAEGEAKERKAEEANKSAKKLDKLFGDDDDYSDSSEEEAGAKSAQKSKA